jgi:starch synthase (maltosyl-transferring)
VNTQDGRRRVVIEGVSPEIDAGRFPIKRTVGDEVKVTASVFADGHDVLAAILCSRHLDEPDWLEVRMEPLGNDRWRGTFPVERVGTYLYTLQAWVDHFGSWRRDLEKKFKAGLDVQSELQVGARLLKTALEQEKTHDADDLRKAAEALSSTANVPQSAKVAIALSPRIADLMERCNEPQHVVRYGRELRVTVDLVQARFSAWFELFPRSASEEPGKHGTFQDCERWLPRIAEMGFDVLYLPPIHPIGLSFRKGRNNTLACSSEDPGSPWAIGSEEGGHKAVHPQLGTLDDFRRLVKQARELQIEVALDIAFQCSPDHPYVREHPEWFRKRPDGSIQYAENPPKKYQDIYPLDFECEEWKALWLELKSVFAFWADQGVRIFRVDNPHTKPFRFWEWCIRELKSDQPELVFLAEAFTRPKVMFYLAKLGFTQSYNYFPWRNTKYELVEYLTELTQGEVREFFQANLWPNTPDILTQHLQFGGRPAFMARLVLAATLGASYGIYGPAFLAAENQPREPGSEEYLNSEKYELRHWAYNPADSLVALATRLNRIRREHPALQRNDTLQFHPVDNDHLIAYTKSGQALDDIILVIVNLDPHHTQRGWVTLPLERWGLRAQTAYQFHDLLTDARFLWSGPTNYVELDPRFIPAHVLRLRRYVRTERDFDYFL